MEFEFIKSFVFVYWRELLALFCSFLTLLLYVFRKRPSWNSLDEIKEDVLLVLPKFINTVEEDGNGQRKKNAVLDLVKIYVKKKFKVDCSEKLLGLFSDAIEDILSTPQKK